MNEKKLLIASIIIFVLVAVMALGIILSKSCSILLGSLFKERPNLLEILFACVSTAIPNRTIKCF